MVQHFEIFCLHSSETVIIMEQLYILCYDFKQGLDQEECLQCLKLAYGDEAPSCAIVFRWFAEFHHRGQSSFLDEEHTGRPLSAVISENVSTI